MINKKKILIVSYFFPPLNNMASRRWAQMIPELSKTYNIYVFTNNCQGDLAVPLSEEKIKRVGLLTNPNFSRASEAKSILQKIIGHLRKDLRTLDSTFINFYIKNKKNFISYVKEIKPDAILATLGPFSSAFFGLLARKSNKDIKLILDFRDPMALYATHKRHVIKRWVDKQIEKRIIINSDLIFITSESYSEGMRRSYGVRIPVVYNGFPEVKKIEVKSTNKKSKIIYYAGQIYKHREPALRLLLKYLDESNEYLLKMRLLATQERFKKLKYIISQYPKAKVEICDPVSDEVINKETAEASVLLILEDLNPRNKWSDALPGKLFESLPFDIPILAICQAAHEMAGILEQTGLGEVCSDSVNLKSFFINLNHYQMGNVKKVEEFSRRDQALKVKSLLETLWN